MKNFKHIMIILSIGLFYSFHQNENIIGKWKVDKLEIKNVISEETTSKWVKFIIDGKMEGGNVLNQIRTTGTWKIDDKRKKIIISSENKSKDDGEYFFEFLNTNDLVLAKDSVKVFLVRTF